jgi:hypothetical protein
MNSGERRQHNEGEKAEEAEQTAPDNTPVSPEESSRKRDVDPGGIQQFDDQLRAFQPTGDFRTDAIAFLRLRDSFFNVVTVDLESGPNEALLALLSGARDRDIDYSQRHSVAESDRDFERRKLLFQEIPRLSADLAGKIIGEYKGGPQHVPAEGRGETREKTPLPVSPENRSERAEIYTRHIDQRNGEIMQQVFELSTGLRAAYDLARRKLTAINQVNSDAAPREDLVRIDQTADMTQEAIAARARGIAVSSEGLKRTVEQLPGYVLNTKGVEITQLLDNHYDRLRDSFLLLGGGLQKVQTWAESIPTQEDFVQHQDQYANFGKVKLRML